MSMRSMCDLPTLVIGQPLRRWIIERYPFSDDTAKVFINTSPQYAAGLAHLLPDAARVSLLDNQEIGQIALTHHPEVFTADQIRWYVKRYDVPHKQLTAPVCRIIAAPPFIGLDALADCIAVLDRLGDYSLLFWYRSSFVGVMNDTTIRSLLLANSKDLHTLCRSKKSRKICIKWTLEHGTYNTILDLIPCVPAKLQMRLGHELAVEVVEKRKMFHAVIRLLPHGYAAFVSSLVSQTVPEWYNVDAIILSAVRWGLNGLLLPEKVLRLFAEKYPRIFLKMYDEQYICPSDEVLAIAQQRIVVDNLHKLD